MSRFRVVTPYMPSLNSLRGRPISAEIQARIDAALDEEQIESIYEPDEEKRLAALEEADVYLCRNEPLPKGIFDRAKKLRLIHAGTNYGERIDMAAAAKAGVAVTAFSRPIVDSVTDHSMALLLYLVRNLPEAVRAVREGTGAPLSPVRADGSCYNWPQVQGTRTLRGMRLGILGMGELGRAFAERARGFAMDISYWNRSPLPDEVNEKTGSNPVDADTLYKTSDVLFVGVGMRPDTRGIVGEKEIRAMPKGSILINIGRGPLVDQDAMLAAIEDGQLAGAGLDVFDPEPFPVDHPIAQHPRIVPTPHIAGGDDANLVSELEAFYRGAHWLLEGGTPQNIVNGVKWAG